MQDNKLTPEETKRLADFFLLLYTIDKKNKKRRELRIKIIYLLIFQLEKRIKVLQNRIDQAYLDKLDQKISEDSWRTHTREWLDEKEQLTMKLLASQKADTKYLENANLILELSKKAVALFDKQNPEQKRRMINLLVSNCSCKDQTLDVQLNPIFNEIVKTKKTEDWCARQDSNL